MKNSILFILASACLISAPNTNFAQAPTLGSASKFVIFSSNGAIGNTGLSHLTGDIGTNTGAITAFGNVNGVMHNGDAATALCQNDLLVAYNQLDTTTPTAYFGPLLGNGDTLLPGVYSAAVNVTLGQDLILNAGGDANAIFIFKVQGSFTTGTAAKVTLINNAQACNVFWNIDGLVSVATGTQMKGTIIANNAAINIASGVLLEGRALSTTGTVTIDGLTANTPVGCGSVLLTGPFAPSLLSTADYALFTGNGENTNSGISLVNGDVGTNVGLTTGYDSLDVNGDIHPIPDASTATAASDLLNVYTYLNTLPADIELLYPALFGNSLTLTPHTYLMDAAATLTDTVFLDAQGNTNAVFVIKINGAFSTGTYATVVLLNGAQAANVFWKVDGAINVNDYSIFKGTIVSNNGAVSLNTGTNLEGRAMTTDGAFTANGVNIVLPGNNTPLSIAWKYFKAKESNQQVRLEWAVSEAMNNGHFIIQRSADGKSFDPIGRINAAEPTAGMYSFIDQTPFSIGYYRLLQTAETEQNSYSSILKVTLNQYPDSRIVILYPNPASSFISVSLNDESANKCSEFILYNVVGKELLHKILTEKVTRLHMNFPFGTYYFKVTTANNVIQSGKLILRP